MNSRERFLSAVENKPVDYIPCSFMLFYNLYNTCKSEMEYITREVDLGLDPHVHVGHLNRTMHLTGTLHPDARYTEWIEETGATRYFCRRIDTPKGPLTSRIRQWEGWPTEGDFPIFKDWLVPRADEFLVKPEQDLEKLPYIFGPFKDSDIEKLRDEARAAQKIADQYHLVQAGGWKGNTDSSLQVDPGVMGCDAMAWLSGFEKIMELSILQPDLIKEYAAIIHAWNMKQIEIYLDVTAADIIIRRGWYETTEFWTPKAYRTIIAPTLKKEAELVHQAGKKYAYIITSAFMPVIDDILDTGIDILIGLDPREGKGTDLQKVKEKFKAKNKCLWGGVSGPLTVEQGTEAETEAAVLEALRILGAGGGFILSPVDNVRDDTPNAWKNTHRFIETWKKHRQDFV
jgi:Uroporphyrinogen decarboxylase (URO-D)